MTLHPEVSRTLTHRGSKFNLVFEGHHLNIEMTLRGLQWLLNEMWDLAHAAMELKDRAPSQIELRDLLVQLLDLEGYKLTGDDEKARIGIITASPVLKLGNAYYLIQGDGGTLWTQPIQILLRDWYISCECIHIEEKEKAT